MSEVVDLIAVAIKNFEAECYPRKVFAWYDYTSEEWRSPRRNKKFRHPAYSKAWPVDWDIVPTERYQFATHDPKVPILSLYFPESAA